MYFHLITSRSVLRPIFDALLDASTRYCLDVAHEVLDFADASFESPIVIA